MQEYVKSLSDRTEIVFVLVVAFGYFMYLSLLSAIYPAPNQQTTTADLYALLVLELKILICNFAVPLYARVDPLAGWPEAKRQRNLRWRCAGCCNIRRIFPLTQRRIVSVSGAGLFIRPDTKTIQ